MRRQTPTILMQNLIYPAIFGAALVSYINKVIGDSSFGAVIVDVRAYFGLYLFAHFALSYVANERRDRLYGWKQFPFDLVEVLLLFCVFVALGYSDKGYAASDSFRPVYLFLALGPVVHLFWNLTVGLYSRSLKWIMGLRFALAAAGFALGYRWPLYSIMYLVCSVGLTTWYLLRKDSPLTAGEALRG